MPRSDPESMGRRGVRRLRPEPPPVRRRPWALVRNHVALRRTALYWLEITLRHTMDEGGVARARDQQEFINEFAPTERDSDTKVSSAGSIISLTDCDSDVPSDVPSAVLSPHGGDARLQVSRTLQALQVGCIVRLNTAMFPFGWRTAMASCGMTFLAVASQVASWIISQTSSINLAFSIVFCVFIANLLVAALCVTKRASPDTIRSTSMELAPKAAAWLYSSVCLSAALPAVDFVGCLLKFLDSADSLTGIATLAHGINLAFASQLLVAYAHDRVGIWAGLHLFLRRAACTFAGSGAIVQITGSLAFPIPGGITSSYSSSVTCSACLALVAAVTAHRPRILDALTVIPLSSAHLSSYHTDTTVYLPLTAPVPDSSTSSSTQQLR